MRSNKKALHTPCLSASVEVEVKVALNSSILTAEAGDKQYYLSWINYYSINVLVRNEDVSSVVHADAKVPHVPRIDKLALVKLPVQ